MANFSPSAAVAARDDDDPMSTTTPMRPMSTTPSSTTTPIGTTTADTPHPPTQLRLIDGGATDRDWLLDERTRRAGRYGVLQVRETLRKASPPQPNERIGPAGHPVAC